MTIEKHRKSSSLLNQMDSLEDELKRLKRTEEEPIGYLGTN